MSIKNKAAARKEFFMDWLQVFTIIGVISGITYWQIQKLDADIKTVSNSLDGWSKHLTAMQSSQSKRSDDLYNVIIEILKKGEK